jgi:hypothetical protein
VVDLPPDAHAIGIALELENSQEDDLFVARHEFFHDFLQLISIPDIYIYAVSWKKVSIFFCNLFDKKAYI